MCPLVVESSISSSLLLLAVNDRQSQSHQLDSTSSIGNYVSLSYMHILFIHTHQYEHISSYSNHRQPKFRANLPLNINLSATDDYSTLNI